MRLSHSFSFYLSQTLSISKLPRQGSASFFSNVNNRAKSCLQKPKIDLSRTKSRCSKQESCLSENFRRIFPCSLLCLCLLQAIFSRSSSSSALGSNQEIPLHVRRSSITRLNVSTATRRLLYSSASTASYNVASA